MSTYLNKRLYSSKLWPILAEHHIKFHKYNNSDCRCHVYVAEKLVNSKQPKPNGYVDRRTGSIDFN